MAESYLLQTIQNEFSSVLQWLASYSTKLTSELRRHDDSCESLYTCQIYTRTLRKVCVVQRTRYIDEQQHDCTRESGVDQRDNVQSFSMYKLAEPPRNIAE